MPTEGMPSQIRLKQMSVCVICKLEGERGLRGKMRVTGKSAIDDRSSASSEYHGDDMRRSALEMNNEVESTQDAKWY